MGKVKKKLFWLTPVLICYYYIFMTYVYDMSILNFLY